MSKGKNSIIGIAAGIGLAKLIGAMFKGVRALAFRWRRALTPLWFGGAAWFVALLWHWLAPTWWPLALTIGAGGLALALTGPRLSSRWQDLVSKVVPDGLDHGKSGVLDSVRERTYLGTVTVYLALWLALRVHDGSTDLTGWTWKFGVLVFGGIWWYHRRIRTIGRADKYLRSYHKLSAGKTTSVELRQLVGSKVTEASGTRSSVRIRVRLAEGITVTHIAKAADALASFWSLRPGAVFVAQDDTNSRHAWLTLLPRDPWKGKITHPMPAPASTTLAERGLILDMGLHADGRVSLYRLQHTLLVGASGSGKSGWLESLMIWLLAFRDVIPVGIDMASGATLGIWRSVLGLPLATDLDSALDILRRVLAFVADREQRLGVAKEGGDDDDSFQPSPAYPWLVLIIDEFPDLVMGDDGRPHREAIGLLSRIAKRSRKVGLRMIFCSQNGSKVDMGAKEIQAQFSCVIGLGLDQHASRVLWGDLARLGWNSTHLRLGQYLQRDAEHMQPDIAKGYWVHAKDRRAAVAIAATCRPQFEAGAWLALNGASSPDLGVPVQRTPADVVLAAVHEHPRKADEIAALPGMPSRATVYRRLKAFSDAGQAHSINGVWYPGGVVEGEVTATR